MTKRRKPQSVEGALDYAIGVLTADGVAETVGKTTSLVRKWANPDIDEYNIQLRQAIQIDLACVDLNQTRPFADLMVRLTDRALEETNSETSPTEALLGIVSQLGDISSAVQDALDPNGSGGQDITANEVARINQAIVAARRGLDELERSVEPRIPRVVG